MQCYRFLSETCVRLIISDGERPKTYSLILIFTSFLQGLYVFAVYFIMHNQLCWPTKASYTVEMSGHDSSDSTFHGGGPTTVGGDISKSTQNLITAMEEVNTKTLKLSTHYRRKKLLSLGHFCVL